MKLPPSTKMSALKSVSVQMNKSEESMMQLIRHIHVSIAVSRRVTGVVGAIGLHTATSQLLVRCKCRNTRFEYDFCDKKDIFNRSLLGET